LPAVIRAPTSGPVIFFDPPPSEVRQKPPKHLRLSSGGRASEPPDSRVEKDFEFFNELTKKRKTVQLERWLSQVHNPPKPANPPFVWAVLV
jgi:hypothetical protein